DYVVQPAVRGAGREDAVTADLVGRDPAGGEHGRPGLVVGPDELAETRLGAQDHVVGEQERAWLALHLPAGTADRMAETKWLLLLNVDQVDAVGQPVHLAERVEHVPLAPLLEVVLDLPGAVEMVHDGALATTDDHDHFLDTRFDSLFDAVLDRGLVDQGEHLFGLRFG